MFLLPVLINSILALLDDHDQKYVNADVLTGVSKVCFFVNINLFTLKSCIVYNHFTFFVLIHFLCLLTMHIPMCATCSYPYAI